MKIYYSGGSGLSAVPEVLVPQRKPRIMLTFYDIGKNGTADRLRAYLKRKKNERRALQGNDSLPVRRICRKTGKDHKLRSNSSDKDRFLEKKGDKNP